MVFLFNKVSNKLKFLKKLRVNIGGHHSLKLMYKTKLVSVISREFRQAFEKDLWCQRSVILLKTGIPKFFKSSLELLVFLLQGHCVKVTVAQRLCYDTAVNSDV